MGRRKPAKEETRTLYRIVWQADPFLLNRMEVIHTTGRDSFPDSSSSAILETALRGLVEGRPLRDMRYAVEELNPNVRAAISQLFHYRDAGQMGA